MHRFPSFSLLTKLTAALALSAAGASQASAAIIYTDVSASNISGPYFYFNVQTGVASTEYFDDYDFNINVNPSVAWNRISSSPGYDNLILDDGTMNEVNIPVLNFGDIIGGASSFNSPFYGDLPDENPHYWGFRLTDGEGVNIYYGWFQFKGNSTTETIQLLGFAYDDSGAAIAAGAVPEPGTTAAIAGLVAGGVAAFAAWRKRRLAATVEA